MSMTDPLPVMMSKGEPHFFDLPLELQLIIASSMDRDEKSFNQDIRSIALTSRRMRDIANLVLNDKIVHLKQSIDLVQKKIDALTGKVDQIKHFFKERLEKIDIVPSLEDQKILHDEHQFNLNLKHFVKIQTEITALNVNFNKIISKYSKAEYFLPSYQMYRVTQKHLSSLKASLRKMKQLFNEKFASDAKELNTQPLAGIHVKAFMY